MLAGWHAVQLLALTAPLSQAAVGAPQMLPGLRHLFVCDTAELKRLVRESLREASQRLPPVSAAAPAPAHATLPTPSARAPR